MIVEIKHRSTGAVLYSCEVRDEIDSGLRVRHALEKATASGAYLYGAYLYEANLSGVKGEDLIIARTRILPDGNIIGWKKAGSTIVKLSIPKMKPVAYRWRHKGVNGNGEWNFSSKPVEGHAFECEGLVPADRRTGPQERRGSAGYLTWPNHARRKALSDRRKQTTGEAGREPTGVVSEQSAPTTTYAGKPLAWRDPDSPDRITTRAMYPPTWEPRFLRPTISEARLKELLHPYEIPQYAVLGLMIELGVEVTR